MFKIFGVNFLKTRSFEMSRLCKATNCYLAIIILTANGFRSTASSSSKDESFCTDLRKKDIDDDNVDDDDNPKHIYGFNGVDCDHWVDDK